MGIRWIGINEKVLRISPAGDGKTELDGMFGRMTTVLQTSIVHNNSYYHDFKTILEIFAKSNGLSATDFLGYRPDRSSHLGVEITGDLTWSSSILTTVLQSDCANHSDALCSAFKHAGYGSGEGYQCNAFRLYLKNSDVDEEDGGKKSKKDRKYVDIYDEQVNR